MTTQQVREWATQLDHDIAMLRSRLEVSGEKEEVFVLLDSSFAELRAARPGIEILSGAPSG